MENAYRKLIEGNQQWSAEKAKINPAFFEKLAQGQAPEVLWIGCADSRVPANEITGSESGEIFVHRNVANLVVPTDLNFLSVLQYAVEVLKVKHIIICGHYGCGGVNTAFTNEDAGLVSNWLRSIKEVYDKHFDELEQIKNKNDRSQRLVELNVVEQLNNLAKTPLVQRAWKKRELHLHAWVYGMGTGKIKELGITIKGPEDLPKIHQYQFEEQGG